MSFFWCTSSGPKSSAFSQESAPVSISQTLNSFSCPANNLRGSGVAANYDQALNYAISKIDAVNKFLQQGTMERFSFEEEEAMLEGLFAE